MKENKRKAIYKDESEHVASYIAIFKYDGYSGYLKRTTFID